MDGLSRRVQIVEEDNAATPNILSTKNYLWIGSEMAEERDASSTVTKRFFPQGEQQIVSGTASPYYYTRDHLGSVRELVDGSGTIQARYSYDPYGNTTVASGTTLPTMGYAGMYWHQPSALYFTRNAPGLGGREYTKGRWLSRDDIGEKGGLNLYEYCRNNPIDWTDPLGLKTCYKWFYITYYNDPTGNHNNALNENDAATANRQYSPNGTRTPNYDPHAPPNQPYPNGMNVIVHRPNANVHDDHRTINDSGSGFAYPRPGMPNGVPADSWLDLWSPRHAANGDPEWDLVETNVGDNCPCPHGWSENQNIPRP